LTLPELVSRNGRLIAPVDAHISVHNPAIYGSYGVYEALQVIGGTPFALRAHLHRLHQSARLLDLPLPATPETMAGWIAEVVTANRAPDCTVRIVVVGDSAEGPVAFLWPQAPAVYPEAFYAGGASAVTFAAERFMPRAKSLNTLASFMARRAAVAAGAHEGLLHHDGRLTEGSNSNLFGVLDGRVLTPPASEVLSGVTRDILICLSVGDGDQIVEAPLLLEDVARWSECFITSTSRHVMPITSIDGVAVGGGRVGPRTRHLMALFERHFEAAIGQAYGSPGAVAACEEQLLAG